MWKPGTLGLKKSGPGKLRVEKVWAQNFLSIFSLNWIILREQFFNFYLRYVKESQTFYSAVSRTRWYQSVRTTSKPGQNTDQRLASSVGLVWVGSRQRLSKKDLCFNGRPLHRRTRRPCQGRRHLPLLRDPWLPSIHCCWTCRQVLAADTFYVNFQF